MEKIELFRMGSHRGPANLECAPSAIRQQLLQPLLTAALGQLLLIAALALTIFQGGAGQIYAVVCGLVLLIPGVVLPLSPPLSTGHDHQSIDRYLTVNMLVVPSLTLSNSTGYLDDYRRFRSDRNWRQICQCWWRYATRLKMTFDRACLFFNSSSNFFYTRILHS